MPMRLELGAFTIEVERQEDAAAFLCGLLRRINNKELGALLGVTDKTVRRWRRERHLPPEEVGHLTLLHVLHHLVPPSARPGSAQGQTGSRAEQDGGPAPHPAAG